MGIISPVAPISRKPLKWVGSAKRDLDGMPGDVQDVFGHAIDLAQAGGKHPDAKALHCFQKKSKSGIKTPKEDLELIKSRLKAAAQDFEAWRSKQGIQR